MEPATRSQIRPATRSVPTRHAASDARTDPTRHPTEILLSLSAWWDPHLAVTGHDPRGDYAESHWLPVLGPSALLALRWMSRALASHPQGLEVAHRDFARAIGLGDRTGSHAPSVRCLERLCYFDLARSAGATPAGRALAVRTHVPDLPEHLRRRLPRELRRPTRP